MSPARLLRRLLTATLMAMALSCLLARPVVDLAHDVHEARHATLAADAHTDEADDGDSLGDLLHAVDCCLHGATLPATSFSWSPAAQPAVMSPAPVAQARGAPLARFLRPPISA